MKIAIAENSVIIRSGVTAALKRLPDLKIQPMEVSSLESLVQCSRMNDFDMLIINPSFEGYFDILKFRRDVSDYDIKIIALTSSYVDKAVLNKYDDTISVYDDSELLHEKITALQNPPAEPSDDGDILSSREKEIVICVVRGMTNKEIADVLFLSIHTVITHRRNIAKKLQIHSPAGLTIYAIVNNLVEISEIKKALA
jgi:Response regulator containing a CheY-like receiver domain and an HTH DNA-binding domain